MSCSNLVADLMRHLETCSVPAAYRGNYHSSHFYTGYPGSSLPWEFYLDCTPANSPEFIEVCTCLPENNADMYEELSGNAACPLTK